VLLTQNSLYRRPEKCVKPVLGNDQAHEINAQSLFAVSGSLFCAGGGSHAASDLVPYVPQFFVKRVLLALPQNVHRIAPGADHVAADDPLR
jgi:hypothetical protein